MIRVLHAVVPRFTCCLGLDFQSSARKRKRPSWSLASPRVTQRTRLSTYDFATQSNVTSTSSEHLCQKQDRFQPWMRKSELPA